MKNAVVLSASAPMGSLVTFVTTILVARYLLSEGFGVYSTIMSVISFFGVAIEGGRTMIMRDIAREPGRLPEIFGETKGMLWLLSAAGFLGVFFVSFCNETLASLPLLTYLVAGLIMVATYHAMGNGIMFLATERMHINAIGSFFCRVIALILVALSIWLQLSLNWILASLALANFAMWGFYHLVFIKYYAPVPTVRSWERVYALSRRIASVGSIFIVRRVSWNIDILLLTWLATVKQSGIFNGAYSIVFSANMLPIFVGLAFFPMISRMGVSARQQLIEGARRYLVRLAICAIPFLTLCYFWVEDVVLLLLGEHYLASIPILEVLVIDVLFSGIISVALYLFVAMDLQKLFLFAVSAGLIVNVALDLLLIPSYGALGAAYGTLAADILCFLILLVIQFRVGSEDKADAEEGVGKEGGQLEAP